MFDTLEEALDTNSTCAHCMRSKFKVAVTYLAYNQVSYSLVRCTEDNCQLHCSWDHTYEKVMLDLSGPDAVSIVSGW